MAEVPPLTPGGHIRGGTIAADFPLHEGERVIDQDGYTRAVWSGGRLLWFPLWFSRYLLRQDSRRR